MDKQMRLKLLNLYDSLGNDARAKMRREFPDLLSPDPKISSFRVGLDPGVLLNQDGQELMRVNGGNKVILNSRYNWFIVHSGGYQFLMPRVKFSVGGSDGTEGEGF